MRAFIVNTVTTLFIVFGIINAPVIGKMICLFSNPAKDVFTVLMRSVSKHPPKKILLIGDSVSRQVFGNKSNGDTLNLCENQAYEIPGNYLLLKNLISHENTFDTVILYFNPFSLTSGLNQIFTYNYFVKPFRPYLRQLDAEEQHYIDTTYPSKSAFDFLPVVRYHFSSWQSKTTVTPGRVSEISLRYLQKIQDLCHQNHMVFQLKSLPVKASRVKEVNEIIRQSRPQLDHSPTLKSYFDQITYLPDSLFLDDVHYVDPRMILRR